MLTVLGIAATKTSLFALRGDGAVFILFRRGEYFEGQPVEDPFWAACPAVPGSEAAREQQG